MEEVRAGVRCVLVFGHDLADACVSYGQEAERFIRLNNPVPTGDHWRVIGWVTDHIKLGDASLRRMPNIRREVVRKGAAQLQSGAGFILEIGSMAARRFRDQGGLRMQRGKVFAFVSPASPQEQLEPEQADGQLPEAI